MTTPTLPATDDPWALLGVDEDAPADVVRRAYLAKIKVYKPDRAPEEFRRIRAAYESIVADAPRPSPPPPAPRPAATASPDEPADEPASPVDDDTPPRPRSPYLEGAELDVLLAERRIPELRAALYGGRIAPEHALAVVHALGTLSVLVDTAAFERLATDYAAQIRELAREDHAFALRIAGGPAIAAWVADGRAPCPALLAMLVELPIAAPARRWALARALADTVRTDPVGVLAALDAIASTGIDGARVVTLVLDELVSAMPDEVRDRRMLQLNAGGFPHRIERERSSDRRLSSETGVVVFTILGLGGVASRLGAPTLAVVIGLALLSIAAYVLYDPNAGFYQRKLRGRLVEQLWHHPVPSTLVLEALQTAAAVRSSDRDAFRSDSFEKYVTLVAQDPALLAFADLTWFAWATVTLDAQHVDGGSDDETSD